jgi:hypothetical protein
MQHFFYQDKSIIETPLKYKLREKKRDIGKQSDETLNKEYKKKAK